MEGVHILLCAALEKAVYILHHTHGWGGVGWGDAFRMCSNNVLCMSPQ